MRPDAFSLRRQKHAIIGDNLMTPASKADSRRACLWPAKHLTGDRRHGIMSQTSYA